ncbi:MAG: zinc ribbon domain-containing protein, partial [Actinomycetota bacterium]
QADLDMLKRRISEVEDRELDVMGRREELDAVLAEHDAALAAIDAERASLAGAIEAAEGEIDTEIAAEQAERDAGAAVVGAALLADYEERRARNKGSGAARLTGVTCGACHLGIPVSEAEEIRRGGGATAAYCDNCGAILVP